MQEMKMNLDEFRLNFSLVLAAVLYPVYLLIMQLVSGTEHVLWGVVVPGVIIAVIMLTPWFKQSSLKKHSQTILSLVSVSAYFVTSYIAVNDNFNFFSVITLIVAAAAWNAAMSAPLAIFISSVAPLVGTVYIMTILPIEKGIALFLGVSTCLMLNLLNSITRIFIVKALSQTWIKLIDHYNSSAKANEHLEQISSHLQQDVENQSMAVQETVFSLDQIRGNVENTLGHTELTQQEGEKSIASTLVGEKGLNELSQEFRKFGERSSEHAKHFSSSVNQMNHLIDVTDKVRKETSAIDDLVFQTRLLAFNASVEAARAGEHGKGFSVVAEEIAILANSSGVAATKINEILEESQKSVQEIVSQVKEQLVKIEQEQSSIQNTLESFSSTVKVFDDIRQNVERTGLVISKTNAQTKEQKNSIEEISRAMESIHRISANTNKEFEQMNKVRDSVQVQTDWIREFLKTFEAILPLEEVRENQTELYDKKNTETRVSDSRQKNWPSAA